jgi:cytochrome c biogenesis protein CcdA
MKAIPTLVFLLATAAAAIAAPPPEAYPTSNLVVYFFGSATCGECQDVKAKLLKPLQAQHAGKLNIRFHEVEDTASFALMIKLEEVFGVQAPSPLELFLPDTFLLGFENIMAHGQAFIEERLGDPARWTTPFADSTVAVGAGDALRQRIERFTFWGILVAGLVDGVNPCAIATMVFLISFLATQKRKRTEVLAIGLAFTLAVYATYFFIGLGAFQVLTALGIYRWLSIAIKWSAVAVAGAFSLYSFRDAWVYGRTGKAQDIKLQLPKALKMRIHKVISGNLSSGSLVAGSIVTGFLVTLLEAVCTGQVYLPTIILMTRDQTMRLQGYLYLAFYNFLFVLPLLLIMVFAYFGLTWNQLSKATQKHMVSIKVLLGVVLAGLAVFLGVAG